MLPYLWMNSNLKRNNFPPNKIKAPHTYLLPDSPTPPSVSTSSQACGLRFLWAGTPSPVCFPYFPLYSKSPGWLLNLTGWGPFLWWFPRRCLVPMWPCDPLLLLLFSTFFPSHLCPLRLDELDDPRSLILSYSPQGVITAFLRLFTTFLLIWSIFNGRRD